MRLAYAGLVWVAILFAGCGAGPPPLDELPLRDTLRADPEVVAALPDEARARLAARLETARARDSVSEDVAGDDEDPSRLVASVDDARAQRDADPLIVGAISGGVARPFAERADESDVTALPSLEDAAGGATADAEAAALGADAGNAVRALLKASRASRLRRVTGWPTGAMAIGDVVYVNAAWLVALAPDRSGRPDGGASALPASGASAALASGRATAPDPGPTATAREEESALARSAGAYAQVDGGTPPPPEPPPAPDDTSFWDACSACSYACATSPSCGSDSSDSCDDTSDDGSSDSCDGGPDDGSSDSCDTGPADGSSDSCDTGPADGSSDACSGADDGSGDGCQVARAARPRCRFRGRHGGRGTTEAWLLAPLGFLAASQRKRRP
jgi:hypothetical protein